jgi:hypothetical protein
MTQPAPHRHTGGQRPSQRRLRVFAFDPGVRAQLETLSIGELTLKLSWEDLEPGPVGDYVEVVDYDPASDAFYAPVDLNHPYLLAQDGLSPAEGGPQFHQQMVYAVAMNTIDHFERALGRVALWANRMIRDGEGRVTGETYVPRLRIYPHALREANAYYSPRKKALLFGYFPTRGQGPGQAPGGMVFTSLSYDVVAHETTHALLDGLHPSFNEATNPDVHALHEGFADVVALFQRFAHPEILEHQIARTRGNLERQSMLGELAQQFGLALGMRGALREALGSKNEDGVWEPARPDPARLKEALLPHDRGGILLAAVFSAFLAIYRARSADLLRIATNGTGVLREGEIHPDLVCRLAREAAAVADAVLTMCIRGLDYCPPVDVDFGTYLRGVITADAEVYPQDQNNHRVAFIEAFRQWGIYPEGVRSMAESDLRYPRLGDDSGPRQAAGGTEPERRYNQAATKAIFEGLKMPGAKGGKQAAALEALILDWDLTADRVQVWETMQHNAKILHGWLTQDSMRTQLAAFGLTLDPNAPPSVYRSKDLHTPSLEVHSVRVARRRGFRGTLVTDLVVEVRQRRRGYFDAALQEAVDKGERKLEPADFRFRRGCTLIIDPVRQQVRYAISTRGDVADNEELDRVRSFLKREEEEVENPFYGAAPSVDLDSEHFAAVHRRTKVVPDF